MGMHEERHEKEAVVREFSSGLRALAIDNDSVSLKVLEILMRMCNYRLTIARDAMMAFRMLREGRDNFDLVISDVYMSDMDGFKLLKLVDLEIDLPVIGIYRTWSSELHGKFVEAVRQIGIKRAVPSKILAAMNMDSISRESVGSHLQKYRMCLKSAKGGPEEKRNLLVAERWNLSRDTLEEGIKYYHGHGMDHPSAFEARGAGVHGGGMLFSDVVPGSSSLLRGVRQWPSSSSSYANRGKSSYMGMLRGNLLGANRGIRSSGSSFADRKKNRGIHQFPVQPSRQPGHQPLVQRTPHGDTGNCLGNSWQAGMKYPDLSRDYWRMTPGPSQTITPNTSRDYWRMTPGPSQAISPNTSRDYWRMTPGPSQAITPNTSRDYWRMTPGPSQANIPNINQLTGLAASPAGQIPMSLDELQNQIPAFLNSTTSMAGSGEEMAPFDVDVAINNNISSMEMLNGRGAGGVLPVQAQGTANQEAVDSQLDINSDEFGEFGDFSMDRIFTITNMLNEDLAINEVNIMDGDL